jgi:very-short-patch-repair endonuclease
MIQDERRPATIDKFRRDTAKRLRKNEMEAEQRLWKALRQLPLEGSHFRRQVPIGPYVADFACLAARVVVEVDGSQHGEKHAIEHDAKRTAWLESQGYKVLRFWNTDVFTNADGVLEAIWGAVHGSPYEEAGPLKHERRRRDAFTPPRSARSRAPNDSTS